MDEFIVEGIEEEEIPTEDGKFAYPPMFKMRPVETVAHIPGQLAAVCDRQIVSFRPIERSDMLCNDADLDASPLRPENKLVVRFCRHLHRHGHPTLRVQIRHTPDHAPMFTDIWVDSAYLLIEAKVEPTRENVRMALSQMDDYQRFLENPKRAVLLQKRPPDELIELAHSRHAAVIWPSRDSWLSSIGWLENLGIRQGLSVRKRSR
ncbi:hypothetical protein ACT1U9_04640 [Streptomyces sp. BR1]|uniref:hypothetical protein n=1 Tax=Streptomyces sp. BR1 TaxID=1592323 RepID=UPI00402BD5BF